MKKNYKAFTLVEIMLWILVVSAVMLAWFQAYVSIGIWKVNLIEKSNIQKDSFYFTEKLFQLIKQWGTIDYEEYFNRKVVWTNSSSWNYISATWFWNFWKWWDLVWNYWAWFYFCRSLSSTTFVSSDWCYDNPVVSSDLSSDINWNNFSASIWDMQRYGQYSFQFIDYNSNMNNDLWDENIDANIIWDDDDEVIWLWPIVFNSWDDVKELYLISWDWTKRTLIRWNITRDVDAPSSSTCDATLTTDFSSTDLEWCRWTVEFLKLEWVDWWMDHLNWTSDTDNSEYDWVIDTWLYDRQFTWWTDVIATTWDWYWKELFPDTINVTDFRVYVYPNVDPENSWKDDSASSKISPYVTINFKIKPSWSVRARLRNEGKEVNLTTTINLTEIYSN